MLPLHPFVQHIRGFKFSQFYHRVDILLRSKVNFTLSICFIVNCLMSHTHTHTRWHSMERSHSAGLRWPRCLTGGGTLGVWQTQRKRDKEQFHGHVVVQQCKALSLVWDSHTNQTCYSFSKIPEQVDKEHTCKLQCISIVIISREKKSDFETT